MRDMLIACRTVEPFPLPHGVSAINAADMSGIFICNYSANSAAITLAPIKGRLCGAKRGGDNPKFGS